MSARLRQVITLPGRYPLIVFLLGLVVFLPVFFLFSYNSGYGYDAVEYLVIARSLREGFAPYHFIPSKSWAFYVWLQFVFSLAGGNFDHFTNSFVITAQAGVVLSAVYKIASDRFDRLTGLVSSFLVALSCFFMEMNFLEPEAAVVILGLGAYWLLTRQEPTNSLIFVAGQLLGLGVLFKSVAAFYFVGVGGYWTYLAILRRLSLPVLVRRLLWFSAGLALWPALAALYFGSIGKLAAHLEWSYLFPLIRYPASAQWLAKFFVKLSWFHLLLLYAVAVCATKPKIRGRVGSESFISAFFCGLCAALVLLKNQASHYFFPAATFLAIIIARVLVTQVQSYTYQMRRRFLAVSVGACLALAMSIVIYKPSALTRLATIKTYATENSQAVILKNLVPQNNSLLALTGGETGYSYYLLSGRYPNVPFINTGAQAATYLKNNPQVLVNALDDQNLAVIIYNDESPTFDDAAFFAGNTQPLRAEFEAKLKQFYLPAPAVGLPDKVWLRK